MKLFIALCTACLFTATTAHSASVEWTLDQPLTWSAAGSLSGSFLYDADTDAFDLTNLEFTCYQICPGMPTRSPWWPVPGGNGNFLSGAFFEDHWAYVSVTLNFSDSLASYVDGGTVAIDTAYVQNMYGGSTHSLFSPPNTVSASVVPVPAAAWLFGSALAGLGWMRRRKTV
ncbi:MAG: VPLPA-CTERM sorting domain-containing protein [Gammaproteobacteria bacterium]|nr:VPLPA-CTERM sorting domain-containing protein [Gammaproteobacteria bacterium]